MTAAVTKRDRVAEMTEANIDPKEIAKKLGMDVSDVYSLRAKIRQSGDYPRTRQQFARFVKEAWECVLAAQDLAPAAHAKAPTRAALAAAGECLRATRLWGDSFKQERVRESVNGA